LLLPPPYRVILGVGFWVEVEVNRDVQQFISTAEDATDFLNNPVSEFWQH
jgi:hypothetical protein